MRKRKISKRVTDQKLHLQMKDRFEEIRTRENWNASVTEWTNAVSNLKNLVKREKRKGERSSKGATIVLFSQRFILELFVTLILSFSPSHLLPFESVEKEQFSNEWGWISNEWDSKGALGSKKIKTASGYNSYTLRYRHTQTLHIIMLLHWTSRMTRKCESHVRRCEFLCSFFSSNSSTICHDRVDCINRDSLRGNFKRR